MPVRFFCECGNEIWQGMTLGAKEEVTTVAQLEKECICSDCMLNKVLLDLREEEDV